MPGPLAVSTTAVRRSLLALNGCGHELVSKGQEYSGNVRRARVWLNFDGTDLSTDYVRGADGELCPPEPGSLEHPNLFTSHNDRCHTGVEAIIFNGGNATTPDYKMQILVVEGGTGASCSGVGSDAVSQVLDMATAIDPSAW